MLIYIAYFIFIAFLAVEYELNPINSKALLVFVMLLLALMAGLRGPGVAMDYEPYLSNFNIIYNIDDPIFLTIFEPGFVAIVYTIGTSFKTNGAALIMLFFAFTSVFLKGISIHRLSINPYLAILFYFSHYFILHEMTQIRIGLAAAIFLVSLPGYLKGNRIRFTGMILLATMFHYSAILYLLVLLFDLSSFNRFRYFAVLALCAVLSFIRIPLSVFLSKFNSRDVSLKLDTYVEFGQKGIVETVNVFNFVTICNIFCCVYLTIFVPKSVLSSDKKLNFFLKCNLLSIFFLSFFSGMASVAFRFSEIFGTVSMFLFPYLAKYLPAKKYNVFILVILAALIFYVHAFYKQLLNPYHFVNIK